MGWHINLVNSDFKSETCVLQAQDFRQQGKKMKRKMWLENMKIKLIVLGIIIALILIIILSICHGFKCWFRDPSLSPGISVALSCNILHTLLLLIFVNESNFFCCFHFSLMIICILYGTGCIDSILFTRERKVFLQLVKFSKK